MTATKPDLTQNLAAKRQAEREFIAAFIEAHGTDSQRERHAAGVLPGTEIAHAMREHAFESAAGFALFERITHEETLDAAGLREEHGLKSEFRSVDAREVTADQWAYGVTILVRPNHFVFSLSYGFDRSIWYHELARSTSREGFSCGFRRASGVLEALVKGEPLVPTGDDILPAAINDAPDNSH